MVQCKNCENEFVGRYCNTCGQRVTERLTLSHLWNLIIDDIFEVDRGLLYTYKQLWVNPGKVAEDYVNGKTKSYYSPLEYLIFWAAILIIISSLLGRWQSASSLTDKVFNFNSPFSAESISDFMSIYGEVLLDHTDLFYLGMVPFFTLLSYFMYRRRGLYFTELSIPYLYLVGHMISFAAMAIIPVLLFSKAMNLYSILILGLSSIVFLYLVLRMHKQFFKETWSQTIVKGITIVYAGQIVYMVTAFAFVNLLKIAYS